MGTFKGTKGPWKYTPDVVGNSFYIQTECEERFDSFVGDVGGGLQLKNEIEANAKLIAAAPELLEALVELHSLLEDNLPSWYLKKHHNTAINIIKKATK